MKDIRPAFGSRSQFLVLYHPDQQQCKRSFDVAASGVRADFRVTETLLRGLTSYAANPVCSDAVRRYLPYPLKRCPNGHTTNGCAQDDKRGIGWCFTPFSIAGRTDPCHELVQRLDHSGFCTVNLFRVSSFGFRICRATRGSGRLRVVWQDSEVRHDSIACTLGRCRRASAQGGR
jgi:hypothetical protein